jgi:hypothetical protein
MASLLDAREGHFGRDDRSTGKPFVMGSGTVDQIPHVIFVDPLSRELIDENLSIEERHCTAARF